MHWLQTACDSAMLILLQQPAHHRVTDYLRVNIRGEGTIRELLQAMRH
jgi:hypothetical protein